MFGTLLKIAFRNFSTHFKSVLVLMLGIGVPSMLIVGGLSLNDSISRLIEKSFSTNFGVADAYVENRQNNIFFKLPLDRTVLNELKNRKEISAILPVGETFGRIEFNGQLKDCLVLVVDPEELAKFVGKPIALSEGAIVSKDLAQSMNISEARSITLNVASEELKLEVAQIGQDGFLNFRGENLHYAGTVFVNKDRLQTVPFPTRIYMSLKISFDQHEAFTTVLRDELKVTAVPMKARLLNSPVNKALGYLTVMFSDFSIIASLILIYIFAQSLVEERNTTMVTLRILGMKARHLYTVLMFEGTMYVLVAGIFGGSLGVLLGRYLLGRLRTIVNVFTDGFGSIFSQLEFQISPATISIGILVGVFLPMLIFSMRVLRLSKESPVRMLRASGKLTFYIPVLVSLAGFAAGLFLMIFLSLTPVVQPISVWKLLLRGLGFFLASWLVCLFSIGLLRRFLTRLFAKRSVSSFIALSYVERNLKSTFSVAVMFSLIVFVMVIVMTVPHNVEWFIKDRLKTGLFGYNFMVVYNPLKLVFLKGEIDVAEGLNQPCKVYIAQFEDDLITFVDENFLQTAIVPIETNKDWRKRLIQPGTVVIGYFDETKRTSTRTISGFIRSPFRIGGSERVSFEVIDSFDMRKLLVPVSYVASLNSLPKGVRAIPVLLGKVEPQTVPEVKEFYSKRFDFPVYITEELNRLFSGIDLLVQTGVTLLYFGLLSGFSGIGFYTLRNVMVRKHLSGALKALGMTSKSVANAFALESVTIASMGIVVGLLAGFLESRDVAKTILTLLGSERFVLPIQWIVLMVLAIYVVVALVVFSVVRFSRSSAIEMLSAPE